MAWRRAAQRLGTTAAEQNDGVVKAMKAVQPPKRLRKGAESSYSPSFYLLMSLFTYFYLFL